MEPNGAGKELVGVLPFLEEIHERRELSRIFRVDVGSLADEVLGAANTTDYAIHGFAAEAGIDDEPGLRKNGSYPSGHTLLGWSSALLLSEINPDRADTILARGLMYGDSRIIVGAHWQSDVNAARLAAAAAYAKLHTSERFLEQMRLARQEFRVKAGLATIVEMKAYKKAAAKRAKRK